MHVYLYTRFNRQILQNWKGMIFRLTATACAGFMPAVFVVREVVIKRLEAKLSKTRQSSRSFAPQLESLAGARR